MSGYHDPVLLQPSRLFSSVGTCGTNAADDIKNIQKMMANAGYQQATGRVLDINGRCGQATIEAIRWYQRLLHMHPSGLVHPVDGAFMEALRNAAPGWRPKHQRGSLTVTEGQITFDAEGVDYVTAVQPYSRSGSTGRRVFLGYCTGLPLVRPGLRWGGVMIWGTAPPEKSTPRCGRRSWRSIKPAFAPERPALRESVQVNL